MNPWDILVWLLVAIVTVILLACVTVVVFIIVSYSLYLRDKRREKAAAEKELRFGVPSFELFGPGDTLTIGDRPWKVREIESDYDIDFDMDKVRITLSSDRER